MRVIVDEKGRLQLPAEVRRDARIEAGNEVDVSADGDSIIVLPVPPRCAVCGIQRGLLATFGADPVRSICATCADTLAFNTLAFNPPKKG